MVVTHYYYTIFHSRNIKHIYKFCSMLQIGKPEIYVFVQGRGNPDSHSGQKFIFGEI